MPRICTIIYRYPPFSAEIKTAWRYTSILPYVFMAWYIVMHRNNFMFTLA